MVFNDQGSITCPLSLSTLKNVHQRTVVMKTPNLVQQGVIFDFVQHFVKETGAWLETHKLGFSHGLASGVYF